MVKKNSKNVKNIDEPIEINNEIDIIPEDNVEIIENIDENTEQIQEEIEIKDEIENITVDSSDIKTILTNKRKISQKQTEHLKKARDQMKQKEKEKKINTKKINELMKLGVNIDELLEEQKN